MIINATSSGSWPRLTALSATTKIKFVKTVVVLAIANMIARSSVISLLTLSAEFVAALDTWPGTVQSIKTPMLQSLRPNLTALQLEVVLILNTPV